MGDGRKKTVVAVDDDPVILKIVQHTVRKQGYECLTFTSPIRALKHIIEWPPDAIITDFNMPGMTGLQMCEKLQHQFGEENTPPFLILSANPDEQLIENAFDSGAADYLCKPFAAGELKVKLRRILKKAEERSANRFAMDGVPTQIGAFEVIQEIGRGGMGIVYAVTTPKHPKPLALKTLLASKKDVETLLRFRREVDVLNGLDHPGLVGIYEAGQHKGMYFYTMDLVNGQSLRDRMCFEGPMSMDELAPILYTIASALNYLHKHKIIHRDITPGNILIPSDGHIKLADFGLAKYLSDSQLTLDADMLGTPNYMSPETILGSNIDGRSDLFSLGMVALGALMGETPVISENPYSTMRKIMAGEFPEAVTFDVEEQFGRSIDTLLELELDKRFASGQAFLQEIERFVDPALVQVFAPFHEDAPS
jgi:serine/threonine protein kinase/CheY-like chemotaxis protein